MKNVCGFLICLVLSLSLLFASCDREECISSEISDHHEDLFSHVTEEEPIQSPAEEITELPPAEEHEREETPVSGEERAAAGSIYTYTEPDALTPYTAACATANVRVRRGAGTGYGILQALEKGDSLPYLWREGEWLAVWTGDRVGYLSVSYAYLSETNRTIERVIRAGLAKLGTPYQWGATRVLDDTGGANRYFTGESFDCSSFVQYCFYIGSGIKLGHYTGSQADQTLGRVLYRYADLKRGDFYFTGSGNISHVVIYLGNGLLLQTYSANGGPVSITTDERWKGKFLSGRRPDLTVVEQFR